MTKKKTATPAKAQKAKPYDPLTDQGLFAKKHTDGSVAQPGHVDGSVSQPGHVDGSVAS